MNRDKSIENLKKYIEEDDIYTRYKNGEYKELNEFEIFCIKHCQDIEIILGNLVALIDMQKSANRELKNSIPKKKIKDIMKKLNNEYKKIDDSIDIYSNSDDRGKVDCLQMISWFEGELEELLQESEE